MYEQKGPERNLQKVQGKGVWELAQIECALESQRSDCIERGPSGLQLCESKVFLNHWLAIKLCRHKGKP